MTRPLTLRQYDRLWRILEPTHGRFATTKAEIAAYQALVDRGLARWVDSGAKPAGCRIAQILPAGMRAVAEFYASGRFAELGTLKPAAGGTGLALQLPALCLNPNTRPPPPPWRTTEEDPS